MACANHLLSRDVGHPTPLLVAVRVVSVLAAFVMLAPAAGCRSTGHESGDPAALPGPAHPQATREREAAQPSQVTQVTEVTQVTQVTKPQSEPEDKAATTRAAAPQASATLPLGVNLAAVNYYASAIPFVDVMKMADPFQSTHAPDSGVEPKWDTELADKIPRDDSGYPLEAPSTVPGAPAPQVLRASVVSTIYGGRYVVLYDGEGELAFPASPARIVNSSPGRVELDVQANPEGTLFMTIVRSNRANHLRNIRILLPGYEQSYAKQVFHPTFLSRLHGVGAVRFMDWGATNGHPKSHWSERTRPDMPQGGEGGVAYEYMIDLANRLDADAWFCVPHRADDAYVEALAKLIKARLSPQRRVYIEYSNELWNGIFEQARWVTEQGCRVGLNKLGSYAGGCDEDGPRYWAGIKWNARRSGEIFQIFDKVFGAQKARVIHVLAGQAGHDHLNEVLLRSFEDASIQPVKTSRADALAIAPYLGATLAGELADKGQAGSVTVPALLDKLDSLVKSEVAEPTRHNYTIAQKHGLRLVAYEGGQHLVAYGSASNDGAFVAKLIAANRNPRMRSIYMRMLDAWYENSGQGLLMLFNFAETPNKYGAWGLLEGQEQPMTRAPKYQAFFDRLQRLSAQNTPADSSGRGSDVQTRERARGDNNAPQPATGSER